MKISFGIITFNEEIKIRACLESIKDIADEIIIIDSGSSDSTIKIAKEYTDKIFTTSFKNCPTQHNKLKNYAKNEWLFNLEADEILTEDLKDSIRNIFKKGKEKKVNAFCFPRETYILNPFPKSSIDYFKAIKKERKLILNPRSYPNFVDRLHRRDILWVGKVHSKLAVSKGRKFLPHPVKHFMSPWTKKFIQKRNLEKSQPLDEETKKFYSGKMNNFIRFFKDNFFYMDALLFKLKMLKKGPKYWIFVLKWFLQYYSLVIRITSTGKPHDKWSSKKISKLKVS